MNSLENSKKIFNYSIVESGEAGIENGQGESGSHEKVEKSIAAKSRDSLLDLKTENEKVKQEEGISFEKVVAKGVVGFAVAAALMSAPQFNHEAVAAEGDNNVRSEHSLGGDDITDKLNREFAEFADENLKERIKEAHKGHRFKEDIKESTARSHQEIANNFFKDDTLFGNTMLTMQEYTQELTGSTGEAFTSIEVLPEGGVMLKFSGDLKNIADVPSSLAESFKSIKDRPSRFISKQILNVAVMSDVKKSMESFVDEHTVIENPYE